MLSRIDIVDKKECRIDIDYYVPFNIDITLQNKYIEDKIYWIADNPNDSFLEIGISKKSGELMSITLTVANNVATKEVVVTSKKVIEGNPVFNISKLKHEFNKECKTFQVILTESYILVSFNSTFNIETMVKMNRIEIGFGISNDISLIRINNLTHEEYVDLRDSFKLYR